MYCLVENSQPSAFVTISTSTISITAISVANVGLLLWLGSRNLLAENQILRWVHSLWTGVWLSWLLAWAAFQILPKQPILAIALSDIGSFLLVGCAVARLWGKEGLKRFAKIVYPVFVTLDLAWPALIYVEWSNSKAAPDVFYNTLLFAPSLCLVLFAMGLFGWSQLHSIANPVLRFTGAFAAGGYALFQLLIYQVSLFASPYTTFEAGSARWKGLMVTWRLFFVLFYWIELLADAGIKLPAGPAKDMVSRLGWLPPVIVTVVLERYLR
jgi:hypothetical protein